MADFVIIAINGYDFRTYMAEIFHCLKVLISYLSYLNWWMLLTFVIVVFIADGNVIVFRLAFTYVQILHHLPNRDEDSSCISWWIPPHADIASIK